MKNLIFLLLAFLIFVNKAHCDDYIVIVFDTSGSMSEYMRKTKKSRMEIAQDALTDVLSKTPPTTKIGLLTFDNWKYDLGPVDFDLLKVAIKNCSPGGGTPLYQYMKIGADRLLEERAKKLNVGSYKLLVVTDGQAGDYNLNQNKNWNDGSVKLGYLKDIISRGIIVDVIGLDMKEDHLLKNQINGFYMNGNNPESLHQGLTRGVAEVGFNAKDSGGEEFFNELSQVPEAFVKGVIFSLNDFPNHPIGERPPLKAVKDGVLIDTPNPDSVVEKGSGFRLVSVVIIVIITILMFFIVFFGILRK